MGRDKTELEISGQTLLERTVATLASISDEILLAGLPEEHSPPRGCRAVPDAVPDIGPLGGLLAGLRAMKHVYGVVVACDHPFLDAAVLASLLERADGFDAVVPVMAGRPQPAHAVYARTVAGEIETQIASGRYALHALLDRLHVDWVREAEIRSVDPQLRSFFNVNTPAQWEAAAGGQVVYILPSEGRIAKESP